MPRTTDYSQSGAFMLIFGFLLFSFLPEPFLLPDESDSRIAPHFFPLLNTEDDYSPEVIKHEPGEKYWNPNTNNWEKDGKPYSYRVSYRDLRDGEIHTHNYADVDNGYEDYQYYNKQWWAADTQWDHVPPDEE